MFGYLERQLYSQVHSQTALVLVKYYDFDYEDLQRFFELYGKETGQYVELNAGLLVSFDEWKKSLQNPNYHPEL